MQTTQNLHFLEPTHIVHNLMDSIRIYKMFERFPTLDNMDPPKISLKLT